MNKYDLSGEWALFMDSGCAESIPFGYNDSIMLPDTTSHAEKGKKSDVRESGFLTDPYKFEGCAWFKRDIALKSEWSDKKLYLRLERTRMTAVYLDGIKIGEQNSLCAPHIYKLPYTISGVHTLEICVKNVGYPTKGGHLTSPDTQTNWNGITGDISLIVRPAVCIDDITVLSKTTADKVIFTCVSSGEGEAFVTVDDGKTLTVNISEGENIVTYIPEKPLTKWDEFTPNVHKLHVSMNGEMNTVSFGVREISISGRKLYVNGRETFLRGKHDGMIFPLTGFAPTDVQGWLDVMKTAKEYGINHYRFHTCCPPDAAFEAADILGIYMQPELPFWGTVDEEITGEQQYLIDEGFRILKEYGNHPSFVMMSMGNELWGSKERLSDILLGYKKYDDRHLYADGSNNFQFFPCVPENSDFLSGVRLSRDRLYRGSYAMCDAPQGFIQTDAPNTAHNYDRIIVPEALGEVSQGGKIQIQYGTGVKEVEADSSEMFIPEVPVISHEVGQYETYPDYSEIDSYVGTLKPENIKLYKEKAEAKGMADYADRFFMASGRLAADCYKREIEAALKSEELSGFQLLDIQDFTGQGTALVGVLNSLMQPKRTITAAQWRMFCSKTVIMAEFGTFVFRADEAVGFDVTLFNTDPSFSALTVSYRIENGEATVLSGQLGIHSEKRVNRLGTVSFNAVGISEPCVFKLVLEINGTDISNEYSFIVYPETDVRITRDEIAVGAESIKIVHSESEAGENKSSLLIPDSAGKLEGTYCTDFWCYPMFRSISESMNKPVPIGTLGCLIEREDPALKYFPSETYSTPQWFEIIMHSHCEDLDGTDIIPKVWMIDNPDRAKKLGIIFDKETAGGRLTVCTSRLWEIADRPEAKYLAYSLFRYIKGQ